jgi:DNA-binding NarL/FixJ family response regulator
MTAKTLLAAERRHHEALRREIEARHARDEKIREALASGWTMRQVASTMNISLARIGQIAHESREGD